MNKTEQNNIMQTGISGLDQLLEGGIGRGNSLLIEGPPGSGKTTLGVRIIHEGIVKYNEPGLLISFEEIPRQIYQEAEGFGVELAKLESDGKLRVVWTTPQRIIEGFTGKNDLIQNVIEELGIKRILIDSLTHFRRVAIAEKEMRELLSQLLNFLKLKNINSFLVKELDRIDDNSIAFEEYLVDASLRLYNTLSISGGENQRYIEIRKTRGQGHISGRHPLMLGYSRDGLSIFPRLRIRDINNLSFGTTNSEKKRVSCGISELDKMLYGGFHSGSLNLLSGYPGSGKSVIAGQFLEAGLQNRESVLMLTGKGNLHRIIDQMESVGLKWGDSYKQSKLHILAFNNEDPFIESIIVALISLLQRFDIRRIVIDSLDDIWNIVKDENRFRNYVQMFAALFDSAKITSMLLKETKNMGGLDGDGYVSVLSSSVIQLSISETDGALNRFISIKKHSGSNHAKELMEITIDNKGCHINNKAAGLSGILTGNCQSSSTRISENAIESLGKLVELYSNILDSELLPKNLNEEMQKAWEYLSKLDILLSEHFGITQFCKLANSEREQKKAVYY